MRIYRLLFTALLIAAVVALVVWLLAKGLEKEKFIFHTPAYQGEKDLKNAPGDVREAFFNAWDMYVNRYTVTASTYNLSGGLNYTMPGDFYMNPKDDPSVMQSSLVVPIRWQAFPGRILYYMEDKLNAKYKDQGKDRLFELVDIGPEAYQKKYNDSIAFIPDSPCNPNPDSLMLLDPYGPRGWLDEYCEMGIRRDTNGNITKLHFTCENPEYYWTLWNIDPKLVLDIYRQTLENESIEIEDLYLRDKNGSPVIVRETGRPAYDPINKWNHGTKMTDTYGGVMHLTSPPNELSAEIVLAGGAAVLRDGGDSLNVANTLICCSQYGNRFRHSDPHIGQNVYQVVKKNIRVTLLDPVGLYLQEPAYQYFTLPPNAPKGARIQDCFRFVRGEVHPRNYPNNMIMHMIMEVPAAWGPGITLSDFEVLGRPIKYGSQVLEAIEVQLAAVGLPAKDTLPHRYGCAVANNVPSPNYFTDLNILLASFHRGLADSSNVTSNIAQVEQGSKVDSLALVVGNIGAQDTSHLFISFPGTDIKVLKARYVNPGSDPSLVAGLDGAFLYLLTLEVPEKVLPGEYDLLVYNNRAKLGIPVPDMIQVVPTNSLRK